MSIYRSVEILNWKVVYLALLFPYIKNFQRLRCFVKNLLCMYVNVNRQLRDKSQISVRFSHVFTYAYIHIQVYLNIG